MRTSNQVAKNSKISSLMAPALNLTPNTKAQHMAKYSTPLVVIFAVVLTVATGATLVELNRRGRAEFDELATRLSDLDAKYQLLYRDSAVRCSQGTLRSAKS